MDVDVPDPGALFRVERQRADGSWARAGYKHTESGAESFAAALAALTGNAYRVSPTTTTESED